MFRLSSFWINEDRKQLKMTIYNKSVGKQLTSLTIASMSKTVSDNISDTLALSLILRSLYRRKQAKQRLELYALFTTILRTFLLEKYEIQNTFEKRE